MKTLQKFAVACVALSMVAACNSDPGEADGFDLNADAQEDTVLPDAEPPLDVPSPDPDTDEEDTSVAPDTATDTGQQDTGIVDTGTQDSGLADTTVRDTGIVDAVDTTGDTMVADTSDTGGELNRDALPMMFGPGSFLRSLYIDKQMPSSTSRCCFDIDGTDPANDNAIADVLANFGSLAGFGLGTVNQNINQLINNGQLIFLFEYGMWDGMNWQNDNSLQVMTHPGLDAMAPFSDNLSGTGSFEIDPNSYQSNGMPKSSFNTASTTNGMLSASGGTVVLPLDFGMGFAMDVRIKRPQMTATVSQMASVQPGGTVPLTSGKLGGAIPQRDLYNGLNNAVSSCMCYDMGKNKLIQKTGPEQYQCKQKMNCQCSGQTSQLVSSCGFLLQTVGGSADVNLKNASPSPDAFSFGASFTAVGAKITGVAP